MAVLGCASTLAVWLVVVFTHRWGRTVGLVWLLGGAVIYAAYRRRRGLAVWGGGTAVAPGPPHADPTPARQAP
jgi:hypothetical protein